MAVDVARVLTEQESHHVGDVLRRGHAAERHQRIALGGHARVGINLGGHAGADHAGRDGVDADAVASQLLRQHPHQHDDGRLARSVGAQVRVRITAGHGRDGDDGAARGLERVVGGLREQPGGTGVDGEHAVPVLDGVFHQRAGPIDAGIAHEPVEPAEALHRLGHGPRRTFGRAHVGVERQCLGAERFELGHHAVEPRRGRNVHGDDLARAALRLGVTRQPQARGPPDSARRPRHEYAHVRH